MAGCFSYDSRLSRPGVLQGSKRPCTNGSPTATGCVHSRQWRHHERVSVGNLAVLPSGFSGSRWHLGRLARVAEGLSLSIGVRRDSGIVARHRHAVSRRCWPCTCACAACGSISRSSPLRCRSQVYPFGFAGSLDESGVLGETPVEIAIRGVPRVSDHRGEPQIAGALQFRAKGGEGAGRSYL